MASFLDYLKDQLEGTDPSQAAQIPVGAQQTAMANPQAGTATDSPPIAQAPIDPSVQAQADAGINVVAHQKPASGFQLSLPPTQADVPDPQANDRVKGDDVPPNYTPAQMASSKTPMDDNDNPIEHKGAFGQTGTLRKILGTLGDAFLVQGGGKAMYAPKVQQEKESDALVGFAQNPSAAIGRLAAVNPDAAVKLQNQVVNQELAQGRINQASQKLGAATGAKAMITFGQLNQAYAKAPTPEAKQAILAQVQALRDSSGLDEKTMPDPTDATAGSMAIAYTPRSVIQQQSADQTGQNQQANQQLSQGRLSEAARHDKAMEARPTSAGHAPNPTAASLAAPILHKIASGGTPTDAEQQVLAATGFSPQNAPKGTSKKGGSALLQSIMGGTTSATTPTKLPTGATTHGLNPTEIQQGYIMFNGQKLRPKQR